MSSNGLPYITDEEISKILTYEDLIPLMETTLADFSTGQFLQPLRTVLPVEDKGFLYVMPAYAESLGVKLVSLYPNNAKHNLPSHLACIVLMESETGKPLAVMDGELITAMRTAAASAAATRWLKPSECKVLAILGSGTQGKSHFQALQRVTTFEEIRVWSPTLAHAEAFARENGCTRSNSVEEAVKGADVIATVTTATEPILKGAWLKQGVHINAVGAPHPTWRELDDAVMQHDIYADSKASALKESGDVIHANAVIKGEIGEVIAGRLAADREAITIFKSLGMAVEDVVTARWVYDRYLQRHQS